MSGLSQEQLDVIQDQLNQGMDPDAIANSITRINDLDDVMHAQIRVAAQELQSKAGE